MNLAERASDGYGLSAVSVRSDQTTEYDVIARITRRLTQSNAQRDTDFCGFVAALHDNRRLWTRLAADVMQDDNLLPAELKARIIWLSEFVDVQSRRVLRGDETADILLEVNGAVLAGLTQGSREGTIPA